MPATPGSSNKTQIRFSERDRLVQQLRAVDRHCQPGPTTTGSSLDDTFAERAGQVIEGYEGTIG